VTVAIGVVLGDRPVAAHRARLLADVIDAHEVTRALGFARATGLDRRLVAADEKDKPDRPPHHP
jgi:hypothetical protein